MDLIGILQDVIRRGAEKLQQQVDTAQQKLEGVKSDVATKEPTQIGEEYKQEAGQQVQDLKRKAGEVVDEYKQMAQDTVQQLGERAKQTATDLREGKITPMDLVPMDEQKKQQLRERIDSILNRIAQNPNYKKAINSLWTLIDQYWQILTKSSEQLKATAEHAKDELRPNMEQMWIDAKEFLERFTGGRSLDIWIDNINTGFNRVKQDEKLRNLYYEFKSYVNDAINNPHDAVSDERKRQFVALIDNARESAKNLQYDQAIQNVLDESNTLLNNIKQDPSLNKLYNSVRQLTKTLFLGPNGQLTVKPEELRQLKILITSLLLEELKYIPIPRLEGSTDTYDFVLQSINFYGYDLLPEHFHVKFETNFGLDTKEMETEAMRTNITIKITNLKTHMKNVIFWFRRRGLLKFEDRGLADITIGGTGATIEIQLEANSSNNKGLITKAVLVKLDQMKITILDSKYDWVLNILAPFLQGNLKREIENEVERRIKKFMDDIFGNIQQYTSQVLPDMSKLHEVGDMFKREMKDIQKTKDAIEPESAGSVQSKMKFLHIQTGVGSTPSE